MLLLNWPFVQAVCYWKMFGDRFLLYQYSPVLCCMVGYSIVWNWQVGGFCIRCHGVITCYAALYLPGVGATDCYLSNYLPNSMCISMYCLARGMNLLSDVLIDACRFWQSVLGRHAYDCGVQPRLSLKTASLVINVSLCLSFWTRRFTGVFWGQTGTSILIRVSDSVSVHCLMFASKTHGYIAWYGVLFSSQFLVAVKEKNFFRDDTFCCLLLLLLLLLLLHHHHLLLLLSF